MCWQCPCAPRSRTKAAFKTGYAGSFVTKPNDQIQIACGALLAAQALQNESAVSSRSEYSLAISGATYASEPLRQPCKHLQVRSCLVQAEIDAAIELNIIRDCIDQGCVKGVDRPRIHIRSNRRKEFD